LDLNSRIFYFNVNYPGPLTSGSGGSEGKGLYGNIQFLGSYDLTLTTSQDTGGILATGESFLTQVGMVAAPVPASMGGAVGVKFALNGGRAI
jgi:hypothetical protein